MEPMTIPQLMDWLRKQAEEADAAAAKASGTELHQYYTGKARGLREAGTQITMAVTHPLYWCDHYATAKEKAERS